MRKQLIPTIMICVGFLVLILDTKTALSGASEGIRLCLEAVIPSLFPFLFLSAMLTGGLSGQRIHLLNPLCRILRIPAGTEALLIPGLLGGYPVGAQFVADATRNGRISRENGRRMLAFCSNAGPSFLFGIGSRLFTEKWACWALWGIHIASALLVGFLIPGGHEESEKAADTNTFSITQAMQRSIRVMATICGWVILFRIILVFCNRWFLWLLPVWAQCMFAGILELTNGCCSLTQIANMEMRFILCAIMLSFGGLCVAMQTHSVIQGLDGSLYLPGKILQALLSGLMASAVFYREMAWTIAILLIIIIPLRCLLTKKSQKGIVFFQTSLYNGRNRIGGNQHAVSQKDSTSMCILCARNTLERGSDSLQQERRQRLY